MKKYLMLAEICFDWSHGEYRCAYIPDIFLRIEEFENESQAEERAKFLLKEYCSNINDSKHVGARDYYSKVIVKEI